MHKKAYSRIPIQDCGEPLVPIPTDWFTFTDPHAYAVLGAPYGQRSPFFVRQGVCDRLIQAHHRLQAIEPGWRIQIFDAYRPIVVQQFMVDFVFTEQVHRQGLCIKTLTEEQRLTILEQVYQFWAKPSLDPAAPPPHSTGAAVDVTLINDRGEPIDMGSPIDEISERSHPNYFAPAELNPGQATELNQSPVHKMPRAHECDRPEQRYHVHRCLLRRILEQAGFHQHPNEWWHFSYGDQLWAWTERQTHGNELAIAQYGRADEP